MKHHTENWYEENDGCTLESFFSVCEVAYRNFCSEKRFPQNFVLVCWLKEITSHKS